MPLHRMAACAAAACALAVAAAGSAAAGPVPRLGHVFVIVGENTSYSELTAARSPYLSTLRRRGGWLTNYRTFTQSSSLGQYVAMVSGQFTTCEAHNQLPARCHQYVDN